MRVAIEEAAMTKERKIALRVLAHNIDNMSYWEESKSHYTDGDADPEKVNEEIWKIMEQIIKRYNLNNI